MYKNFRLPFLAALISSILTQALLCKHPTNQKIATVDILSITSQFIKQEANKTQTPLQREAAIKDFSHNLESSLQQLAHSKSSMLLPKEAVLTGSTDYTAELKALMEKNP